MKSPYPSKFRVGELKATRPSAHHHSTSLATGRWTREGELVLRRWKLPGRVRRGGERRSAAPASTAVRAMLLSRKHAAAWSARGATYNLCKPRIYPLLLPYFCHRHAMFGSVAGSGLPLLYGFSGMRGYGKKPGACPGCVCCSNRRGEIDQPAFLQLGRRGVTSLYCCASVSVCTSVSLSLSPAIQRPLCAHSYVGAKRHGYNAQILFV